MKKTFFSVAILATLLFCVQKASAQELQGVEINGVIWATTNVGASNPEDYGDYFNWEEAKNACPKGWRLPTRKEFKFLIDAGSEWATLNYNNGRKFDNGNKTFFLPAAGSSDDSNGTVGGVDIYGIYWSSTEGSINGAYNLMLTSEKAYLNHMYKNYVFSVRCVKE